MAKHRKPDIYVPENNTNWPREELARAKEIIKNKQADAADAQHVLHKSLFLFPDAKIAQGLLDINVVPSAETMKQSIYNLSAAEIEKLIQAGGPLSSALLQDAVKLQNSEKVKLLLNYGVVASDETLRQVKNMKSATGKTLVAAFKQAKKTRKAAQRQAFVSRIKHKIGL